MIRPTAVSAKETALPLSRLQHGFEDVVAALQVRVALLDIAILSPKFLPQPFSLSLFLVQLFVHRHRGPVQDAVCAFQLVVPVVSSTLLPAVGGVALEIVLQLLRYRALRETVLFVGRGGDLHLLIHAIIHV